MKIVIFDTETTGLLKPRAPLSEQPHIIEFGAIVVSGGKFKRDFNALINPGIKLSEEVTKITGIKDSDLEGKPTFKQAWDENIAGIVKGSDYWIAHNMPFDYGMLSNELERCDIKIPKPKKSCVCTVQEYAAAFGRRPKLSELYKFIVGEELEQTHRALDDARALYTLLEKDGFFSILS